jgi:hypothetical protein
MASIGIITDNHYILFAFFLTVYSQISITSDQIWYRNTDAPSGYENGIIISNDATLTIDCYNFPTAKVFEFEPGATIEINTGSCLIINDARLTSEIEALDNLWGGIIIEGNPNQVQDVWGTTRNQGFLRLLGDAEICYADIAVTVQGGGKINANGAYFTQCPKGIKFERYDRSYDNSLYNYFSMGVINECTFSYIYTSANDTNGDPYLDYHIYMDTIRGIRIYGNTFEFINLGSEIWGSSYGIKAVNASFKVEKSLDFSCFPNPYYKNGNSNTFRNLAYGIYVHNSIDFNPEIRLLQSVFENCLTGIFLWNVYYEYVMIYGNEFSWDDEFESGYETYGIYYLHPSINLKIVQNEFKWNMGSGISDDYYGIYGTHTTSNHSGHSTEIYKNSFANSVSGNKDYIHGIFTDVSNITSGLAKVYMSCNDYNTLDYGHKLYSSGSTASQRLVDQEGRDYTQDNDAGNTFPSCTDYLVNENTGYYTYKTTLYPVETEGNITIDDNNINTNACDAFDYYESQFGTAEMRPDINEALDADDYDDWEEVYEEEELEGYEIYTYNDSFFTVEIIQGQIFRKRPTFVKHIDEMEHLSIYPNPAENYLEISFAGEKVVNSLILYNLWGVEMYKTFPNTMDGKIYIENVSNSFTPGLYLLVLEYKDGSTKEQKLIIK